MVRVAHSPLKARQLTVSGVAVDGALVVLLRNDGKVAVETGKVVVVEEALVLGIGNGAAPLYG